MKVHFTIEGWEDYQDWLKTDLDMAVRLNMLIENIRPQPFTGLGKPEPLRENMAGWWSRRITKEHRLIYRVQGKGDDQRLEIAGCRAHYPRG